MHQIGLGHCLRFVVVLVRLLLLSTPHFYPLNRILLAPLGCLHWILSRHLPLLTDGLSVELVRTSPFILVS